ncbi:MAG: glycosyltransferase family 2 protein [Clostridia bacterium]|nr:glycosyltransferase family 2 protein [Clostridia bacterium]
MISIIIPIYNQADKLEVALLSIKNQSYSDWEIIIVNDGSQDDPETVFNSFKASLKNNQKVSFKNQSNQGAPAARNCGLKDAQGDYLFFCDADANLRPNALARLFNALLDNTQASYAYSSFNWGLKFFKVGEFSAEKLKQMPYIHTMSLIRRSDFPPTAWDESIKKFQDWDLWLTMYGQGKIGIFVDEILFTISPGGTISSWLPSFAYRFFPTLKAVKKYNQALKIIKEKHGLL